MPTTRKPKLTVLVPAIMALLAIIAIVLAMGPSAGPAMAQASVPGAPTGLTASSITHDSVTLTWDDPGDSSITGYMVLRRDVGTQAPGVFTTVESDTDSAATTYTDTTVSAETSYVYRVRAINAAGTSLQSNYVDVDTPGPLPAAPTGLAATSISHDSVVLGWDDPGNGSITGYVVLRRSVDTQAAGVFTTINANTGSATTSYTDSTVSPKTRYTYRVKAINPEGTSPQSNYVDVDTPAAPPAAPTGLAATTVSHDSITLGWDDPSDDSITGYVVLRRDVDTQDPGVFTTINSNTGSATTSYTDGTVSAETEYAYRVQAVSPAGTGPQSNGIRVTTEAKPKGTGSKPPADQGNTPRQAQSTDATLSALTVNGTSVAGFASSRTSYQYGVASTVTQVTVAATTTDANATVSFSPTDANTGTTGHQVNLSAGRNSVTITVTAEDTTTTKPYRLYVNRGVTDDFGWKAVDDFDTLNAAGNRAPRGPWSDGTTMWVADSVDDKIYAYSVSTKARDTSKEFNTLSAANNNFPTGIWSDNTTMWVADAQDDKIYAYNLSTKARDTGKDFNTLSAAGNTTPTAIWSDRTTMWVADDQASNNKIYAYTMSTKARDPSKDFNTIDAAGNEDPYGIWSNGVTMWVGNSTARDPKIYAYSLSTKARDSSRDFDTLTVADNSVPAGIWSDGTTMWVTDFNLNKLYSYNMPPPPSDDATLSALTVNGTSVAGFAADTTSYQYGVASTVAQVTVGATANHAAATVAFSGTDASDTTDGHQVNLSAGANSVTITVTAEDTSTTEAYTLSVNQGVSTDYGWKAVDDFDTLLAADHVGPYGLWSDGTTMWVADNADQKIYAYSMSTKARDSSKDFTTLIAAGNDDPNGIWSDETTMWVSDGSDKKLYAYNLSTKAHDSSKDFDTLDAAENDSPRGLWSDGTTMWVVDGNDDNIYAYTLSTKARDSDKDFGTLEDAGNANPTGIWSDGVTMWVGDDSDEKLYAYSMSTKAQDSDKDFGTLSAAGNGDPVGFWSDGTTMWVADDTDDKLYSYNMPPPPSDDATLSGLTVAGTSVPGFTADTTSYQYNVANTVTQVTVAATTTHTGATVAFSPTDAETGTAGHQVDLSTGANEVTITVTAEDTTTTKAYTLSVNRGVPAPTNLQAAHGSGRVVLTWDGPANTDISAFQYRVSADGGTNWNPDWTNVPGGNAARTYTVTGLTNGTQYTFQARAVYTKGGQSVPGAVSTVKATPQIPPPAQPSNFKASVGDTETTLTWNNPNDSTITHYELRVSVDGGTSWRPDWVAIPDSDRSTTQVPFQGLTNNVGYTYELRAVNAGGESVAARATATPRDLNPPTLSTSTVSGTEIELTYNEPLDSSSLPHQDQYTVSVSPGLATAVAVTGVSINGAVVTLTVAPAIEDIHTVRLTYRVPSTNAVQDEAGHAAASFSNRQLTNNTPGPEVPGAPTGLTATPQGPNRIDLIWTAPADEGGAALSGYRVEVSTNGNSWNDLVADTGNVGTTHSHTGLDLGNRRHYRVSAINRGGTSQPSSVAVATTDNRPYLDFTARRIRTDSVPTEVGTLRVPVYEILIEASQPVVEVGNRWSPDALRGYLTDATLVSWGVHTASQRQGIPTHYTTWRLVVIPHLPEVRGPNTVTLAVPEGVVRDDLTSYLPNRVNRAPTPFELVVDNLPSSDIKRPRAAITYEPGHPVGIAQTGPFEAVVTFSEPVTGFERNELRVVGATVTSFTSNQSGSVYTATIKPNAPRGEEAVSISISVANGVARDRAGHTSLGASTGLMARPRPTVEIVIPKANPNPSTTNADDDDYIPESGWFYKSQSSAFEVVVKFSKPVTEFLQAELVVEGHQLANTTCQRAGGASITDWTTRAGGAERVATITPSATGIVAISVAAGVAQDGDGYLNLGDGRHFVYMSMPGSDDEQCRITDAP